MDNRLNVLEGALIYPFNDRAWAARALITTGAYMTYPGVTNHADGNRRLALVGDGVMRTPLVRGLASYARHPW